jgi:hypothetical protein
VITLGTPFTGSPKATNAWRVYELASGALALKWDEVFGTHSLYEPIMDELPDRFGYLLMLLDRNQEIGSNYLLSHRLSGLEMEIVEHCCFVQPAR